VPSSRRASASAALLDAAHAGLEIPVELGAEFIHGEALRPTPIFTRPASPQSIPPASSGSWRNGRLRRANGFREAQRAVRQGPRLEHDVSFQTFLARRRLSKKTRIFAVSWSRASTPPIRAS